MAIAVGRTNFASNGKPSIELASPFPAIVVVRPFGSTRRSRLLPVSATIKLPSLATAIPHGVSNFASQTVFPIGKSPFASRQSRNFAVFDDADFVVIGIRHINLIILNRNPNRRVKKRLIRVAIGKAFFVFDSRQAVKSHRLKYLLF